MPASAGWAEEQVWAAAPSPASGPAPRGAGSAPARPGAKSGTSKRQTILPVGLHDGALPASLRNGQLRGAFGTLGLIHDLLAELVIPSLLAEVRQSLGHLLLFHLFACGGSLRSPSGSGALTPSEVIAAWKSGADFVKIF